MRDNALRLGRCATTALVALVFATAASAAVQYTVLPLEMLDNRPKTSPLMSNVPTSSAYGISDNGFVCGWATKSLGGVYAGFVFTRWDSTGHVTELQADGTSPGAAWGVNDQGVAAGGGAGALAQALRWDAAGNLTRLPYLGIDSYGYTVSNAFSINNNGVAVGYSDTFSAYGQQNGVAATRWDAAGNISVLPYPTGLAGSYPNGRARAVNDAGVAVGHLEVGGGTAPLRWDAAGAVTVLDRPWVNWNGASSSIPTAINNAGTAVGYATVYSSQGSQLGQSAVRWDALGHVTPLSSSSAINSQAFDINSAGYIVGQDNNAPCIWDLSGNRTRLADVLQAPTGSYFMLKETRGIDDQGRILVTADYLANISDFGTLWPTSQSFLLIPVPEPSTLATSVLGMFLLLRTKRTVPGTARTVLDSRCPASQS